MQTLNRPPLAADDLALVLALARSGTLAAAAAQLGVDASTVFRSVRRLEQRLARSLFARGAGGYAPSELALELVRHAERIESELAAARGIAQGEADTVRGSVRISTTDTLLHGLLLPALAPLARTHPHLRLDLQIANELANLTRRDADIALRATRSAPGHLVGRDLGPIRMAVYAPAGAADPAALPWIVPDEALPEHPSVRWRRRHEPRARIAAQVNSIQSVIEAVAAGLGVGIGPMFLARGRDDLRQVSDALPDCETRLWLLAHPELRHLRRVAVAYAHLSQVLRPD